LTLGNNEFKATEDATTSRNYLFARIGEAKFPVLCANIHTLADYSLLPKVEPYTIVNLNGIRIGIFGVSTSRISSYPQAKGFIVEDPVRLAKKTYPKVKAESDLVIALTHTGFDTDKLIAKAIPGLAAIVGGDSHTILYEPFDKNKVPIVQAGSNGLYLGRLDLFLERVNGSLVLKKYTGTLIEIDDTISEDLEIIELIESFMKRIEKEAA
jgi:2',3'-cyclic-nucleotide 2'-phosphodiesterase (5'-nucleotidase family)